MEVLNLLKFWRNVGSYDLSNQHSSFRTATTPTEERISLTDYETDDEDSFFDLVFPVSDSDNKEERSSKFVESPKDVFYRRKFSPMQSTPNSKPQSPISLLRSPHKFRVFMLGFKRSKSDKTELAGAFVAKPSPNIQSKRFDLKFKELEPEFPMASVLTRDNSLRNKMQIEKMKDASVDIKESGHKYLNLIKPLYDKSSKKYTEKTRFSDQHAVESPFSSPVAATLFSPRKQVDEKQGSSRTSVFRNLVKSRSSLSAAGNSPSPTAMMRRDDSVMLQQDVQSAILHCKRSYSLSSQSSQLSRSESDSSLDTSAGEVTRFSI